MYESRVYISNSISQLLFVRSVSATDILYVFKCLHCCKIYVSHQVSQQQSTIVLTLSIKITVAINCIENNSNTLNNQYVGIRLHLYYNMFIQQLVMCSDTAFQPWKCKSCYKPFLYYCCVFYYMKYGYRKRTCKYSVYSKQDVRWRHWSWTRS